MKKYTALIFFVVLVAAVALFARQFSPGPFYELLNKPAWIPPDWVFAPVWAVLYLMIALAGWIVWRAQGLGPALGIWFVQLALNGVWSWIMFGQKMITHALVDIAVLCVAIAAFIIVAWPVRRTASALFVPYLLWITYAAALNFELWRLNA